MTLTRRSLLLAAALLAGTGCSSPAAARLLFEQDSPYNHVVVTESEDGLRTLRFERDGEAQSTALPGHPEDLRLSYARGSMAALALVPEPKRVLVVGLGGGSIPMFLHHHYPQARIEAVDIDPVVVQVAKDWFGFREDAQLTAHVGDGRKFVEESAGGYDLIFLDAYGKDSIPFHLATEEFLKNVRAKLAPGGAVVGNVWFTGNPLYDSMRKTYAAVFPVLHTVRAPNSGNLLLIGKADGARLSREAVLASAAAVAGAHRFGFDLKGLVAGGLDEPWIVRGGAKLLVDGAEPTPR